MHELRHTSAGKRAIDPPVTDNTSRGPVVDRVNTYRRELDTNNQGGLPYGQRDYYNARSSRGASHVGFSYQGTNRRGRPRRRRTRIRVQ